MIPGRSAILARFPVDIILPVLATRQSLANDSAMASPRRAGRPSTPRWEAEMATEPKNQRLTERHRQILEVLAIAPRDVNALLTLGFKLETMADLVRSELATVRIETVESRYSKIEVALVQITDAGWRALEGLTSRRVAPRPKDQ